MISKSPSGALSPYYYKGGYFHGIHYGSYFHDSDALFAMMEKEEIFILSSPQRRRILIDLYETNLSDAVIERLEKHITSLSPNIVKLGITTDRKSLRLLQKSIWKGIPLKNGQVYFSTDMEETKTWLVSDSNETLQ